MTDYTFAEKLIESALDAGAEKAEVYLSEKSETEITIRDETPESVNVNADNGYGIRVLADSKIGFYSSNEIDEMKAIQRIRALVKAVKHHTPDPFNVIPDRPKESNVDIVETFDAKIIRTPLSEKINLAANIEKAGKSLDPRIAGFVWVLYGDITETYRVLNSSGIDVSSSGTTCYGFAYCYANDRQSIQTGRYAEAYGYLNQFDAERVGQTTAEFALRMLGAGDFKSTHSRVLFPPEAGKSLVYTLFNMIEADSIQKGKSPFRGKLNKPVASKILSIVDDGTLTGGLATRPYDSEGVPTGRTTVIENGVLKNYLYDSYTARKGKTRSTGNASRSGYQDKPSIHPTNFYVLPGRTEASEILDKVSDGLMVTELSGLHAGINYATADFSVPAKGIMIRDGVLAEPVDNISISGNMFDLLQNISMVCNDLAWEPINGMVGSPSFVVEDLNVIGRG